MKRNAKEFCEKINNNFKFNVLIYIVGENTV